MLKLMRKVAIITLVALIVLFAGSISSANAQMMGGEVMGAQTSNSGTADPHESLDEVLSGLLDKYQKKTIQELNCGLTGEEFERVGNAVMESMHPGEAHKRMDAMMGGEGSESLRLMHVQMGQRYLGCDTSSSVRNFGMIGPMTMFGNNMTNGGSLGAPSGLYAGLLLTVWLGLMAFLISVARYFWKKAGK